MKRRNLLPLILSLLMLTALLGGCGSGNGSASTASASEPVAAAQTTPALAPVTEPASGAPEAEAGSVDESLEGFVLPIVDEPLDLTMFYSWYAGNSAIGLESPDENLMVQNMEADTNIHMEYILAPAESIAVQFTTMIASGDYTDIIENFDGYYPTGLVGGLEDEVLVDLNDYIDLLPHYVGELEEHDFYENAFESDGSMAAVYGIWYNTAVDSGFAIRQDWVDELNLEIPTTIAQWEDILNVFKTEKNASAPFSLYYAGIPRQNMIIGAYNVAGFVSPMGGEDQTYAEKGTDVKFGPVEDGYLEYLTLMSDWYANGLVGNDFMSYTMAAMQSDDADVYQDRSGIIYTATFNVSNVASQVSITPIPSPVINEGDVNHLYPTPMSLMMGKVVTTSCENIEAACKWLDFWFTDYMKLRFMYGVEDLTFTYDENGEPQFTDMMINDAEGRGVKDMRRLYCGGWISFSSTPSDFDKVGAAPIVGECLDTWATSIDDEWWYPWSSIDFTADESTAINEVMTDIYSFVEESTLKFITGEMALSEWDSYVETVEGLGLQTMLDIRQSKLDEYLAK